MNDVLQRESQRRKRFAAASRSGEREQARWFFSRVQTIIEQLFAQRIDRPVAGFGRQMFF